MGLRHLVVAVALSGLSLAAHADTITSNAVSPFTLAPSSDTLSFRALNATVAPGGTFDLLGTFYIGNSFIPNQVVPFTFQDTFTVNGIAKVLTFSGTDSITTGPDTLNIAALGPVAFGDTTLSFDSFTTSGNYVGERRSVDLTGTTGTLPATPEPSTIALLGTGLLGVAGVMRKRFA